MRKKILSLLLSCFIFITAFGQTAYLFDENMAVFYPENFEPEGTLPSLSVIKEINHNEALPDSWEIKPQYGIDGDGRVTVTIAYDNNVDLYGTGLVTGPLRRNGTDIQLWNNDNWGYFKDDGKCLYQSHPWIMGVRTDGSSFGIIADNTWRQYFDLSNPIKITTEGPAFRIIVIERENPYEMMKALGELTGKIELPPLWALGYQQSRFSPSYVPDSKVISLAKEFRKRQIPCDVIWMDINYMDDYRIFTFNQTDFPDPLKLRDDLHDIGFKAGYIIDPGVKKDENYFVFQQGQDDDHWVKDKDRNDFIGEVWPGECRFPDFTRPETREWWAGLYKDFMKKGVDGAWNDMNEPGVFNTPEWTMPTDNIHRGGNGLPEGPHMRYHNVYGTLMTKASYDGVLNANPDKRPFILSRANHLGAQRYCATWTGDNRGTWGHMKLSVPMSITLGLSGQPFSGPDIGGYSAKTDPELLTHWMALGAYFPFSRNHTGEDGFYQEPWAFGEKTENVSRTALNRRYRLMPYFYTLFREAAETGVPLMRPVFFADFADAALRAEEQAFLLGRDLLIIPRWATNVKLPQGDWDVLKLEDTDDGYQPLVALRPGAIVPVGKVIQSTAAYTADSVTLLLNPLEDGTASGLLYDDAGNGFEYRNGDYAVHQFTSLKHNESTLKIEISKTEGSREVTRHYRIGYVTDNEITYSGWTTGNTIYVPVIADETKGIDLSGVGLIFVGGTFNEWSPEKLVMERQPNGTFASKHIKLEAGNHEMKFANQPDFSGDDWGNASGLTGLASLTTGGGANITFSIAETGNYFFRFNPLTLEYFVEKTFNSEQPVMYVAGNFNGWNLSDGQMTLIEDNVWKSPSVFFDAGEYALKFANTSNFSGDDWGDATGLSGTAKLTTGGGSNISFSVGQNGNYTITFNDKSLKYFISDMHTSVGDVSTSGFSIYPNPATEILNVCTVPATGIIDIVSIYGVKYLSVNIQPDLSTIDVSSLPTGMYLVILTDNGRKEVKKLLIK